MPVNTDKTPRFPDQFFSLRGTMTEYSTEKVHANPWHQILMISEGVSMLVNETEKKPLYGAMCAFLPAGTAHRSVVVGSEVTYNSIYFGDETMNTDGIRVFAVSPLFRELFLRLTAAPLLARSPGTEQKCFTLLLLLLSEESAEPFQLALPQAVSENCRKLCDYIEHNYEKPLRLTDFCSVLPYSAKHISRLFIGEMSISLFEYLRMYRIFKASVSLKNDRRGVVHTAYACGYESLSSFYTDFRKYFPVSPKEFGKSAG